MLKTAEITGFYNEFKEGVLAKFYCAKLSSEEQKGYINDYKKWKKFYDEEKSEDPVAKNHRELMREVEDKVTDQLIIKLRGIALK